MLILIIFYQFTLRHRLASLVDEFKRFSQDKIANQARIDALFATYDQFLLELKLVNDHLQVIV